MKRYFLLSFLIHAALLIIVISSASDLPDQSEQKENPDSYSVSVIDNPKKDLSYEMEVDIDGNFEKKNEDDKKCPAFYGGIGIEEDFFSHTVSNVYKGYPAEGAGVRVGDLIESVSGEPIRGEPGTSFLLRIVRDGKSFTVKITRQEICYTK